MNFEVVTAGLKSRPNKTVRVKKTVRANKAGRSRVSKGIGEKSFRKHWR